MKVVTDRREPCIAEHSCFISCIKEANRVHCQELELKNTSPVQALRLHFGASTVRIADIFGNPPTFEPTVSLAKDGGDWLYRHRHYGQGHAKESSYEG
jgi:hypothetical protein